MCELILATDLDGTFLEGDMRIKQFAYNKLLALREKLILIYTTGRPVKIVEEFCRQGYLPSPHFIIADHGTHVVDGQNFSVIDALQDDIIKKWNNGNDVIKALLKDDEVIQIQPLNPPYRVAYYYDQQMKESTLMKIADAGYDAILSCDMYLDIVPQGVNKGSTLVNLIKHFNLNIDLTITAGDSLNDLSLFQTGLKSIVVSNAEPKLLSAIHHFENVYKSEYPGLYGVLDGLRFYDLFHLFNTNAAA